MKKIALWAAIIFAVTLMPSAASAGLIDGLFDKAASGIVSVVSSLFDNAKEKAGQAVVDSLSGTIFGNMVGTVSSAFEKLSLGEFIAESLLSLIEYIANIVESVNKAIFSYVFSELLIMIDYQTVPVVGNHINNLYKNIGLIAGYFVLSLAMIAGLVIFISSYKNSSSLSGIVETVVKTAIVGILIYTWPHVFQFSQKLVNGVCTEIMSYKIDGEKIKTPPQGLFEGGGGGRTQRIRRNCFRY